MSHHRKDAMPTHRSLFLLFLLIPLACLMQAAPARANSYAYAVCTGPHGEPNYSTEGWQPAKQSIGAQAYFTCSGGGGLNLGFAGSSAYGEGDYGAMTFTAPADIVVDGATYLRQTQGIAACSSAGCAKSSELLHYDVRLDALSSETCSPFAHNASGTSSCPNGLSGRYHLGGYSARTLTFRVQCGYSGSGGCAEGSGVPRATISDLEVQLRDESNPQATSVTGALAGTGTHAGTEQLHVEASDKGSGVQLIRLFVDGKTVVSQIIDPNTVDGVDRCTQAEHHIYRVPMPCKDHAGVNLVLDTTSLVDGKHSLVVGIDDAASNYTQAMNNADFEVRNHPAVASGPTGTSGASGGAGGGSSTGTTGGSGAGSGGGSGAGGAGGTGGAGAGGPGGAGGAGGTGGGTGASTTTPGATVTPGSGLGTLPGGTAGGVPTVVDLPLAKGVANGINATANAVLTAAFVKSGGSALTTRYGQRAVVRGSLTSPDGTAIAGARVELSSRIAMPGAVSIDKGGARTRSDGSWTMILPSDVSSRSLSFGYRPVVGEGPLVTQQSLVLQVKAGARLRVTPGTAHNGSTLTFTGLLKGKPIPRAGKVVELQARGKGGRQWITFLAPRASVTGRFTARYRLKNTNGPVTYQFRAVIRRESAYPFLAGTSPVRSVRVR